jgi:hypothetical protein
MSWKVINEVIGRATLDADFCRKLLERPVKTIEDAGYPLTEQERQLLREIHASDIYEFSKDLLKAFS